MKGRKTRRLMTKKENMLHSLPPYEPGEVWSVMGVEDGVVVILAGPFEATSSRQEYLVAPVYFGDEEGFVWTDEDVRVRAEEGPFEQECFVATWNARPALEDDLFVGLGELSAEATEAARSAYWSSLNKVEPEDAADRLGRSVRSPREAAAAFRNREVERWRRVSGRVHEAVHGGEEHPSSASFFLPGKVVINELKMSFREEHFGVAGENVASLLCAAEAREGEEILPAPPLAHVEPSGVVTTLHVSNMQPTGTVWSGSFRHVEDLSTSWTSGVDQKTRADESEEGVAA